MRLSRAATILGLVLQACSGAGAISPPGTSCSLFPDDNVWHADVRDLPVHRRSDDWIRSMGGRAQHLHPDFGDSGDPNEPYGIPYDVATATDPAKVAVDFSYADESDPGPYPVDADTHVENGSDAHALVIEKDACDLYEIFDFDWNGGDPRGGSGAVFHLGSNALRPAGWTSADAAGLPIVPGLIRRDEVEAGFIDHAIRITASRTDRRFVWPARHQAGVASDRALPPMGARFRLKSGFDISGFSEETRVILRAMKTYGAILADNGSNWYLGGAAESGWSNDVLDELKSIRAGRFVAVKSSLMKVDPGSAQVKPEYVGI